MGVWGDNVQTLQSYFTNDSNYSMGFWCSLTRWRLRAQTQVQPSWVGAVGGGDDVAPGADLDRLMTVITQPSSGLWYLSGRGIEPFWE